MITNKYKKLAGDTLIFAIGSFGSKLISFFLVPIYTNVLTTEQYGEADLVTTCANCIVPIASLVIQDAILRYVLSERSNSGAALRCAMIVFLFGSAFSVALTPLANLYSGIREWKYYLLSISITNMASNIMMSYTKAIGKNKLYAIAGMIQSLILTVTNIIALVILDLGVGGYLFANIVAHASFAVILLIFSGGIKDAIQAKYDNNLMKKMVVYSAPLIVNNLSWWVLNSSDRVMISVYCSESSLGLYAAAAKIPAFLTIVTGIFSNAWTISAINDYDNEQDKSFYSRIFRVYSIAIFLGGALIVAFTKWFMRIYVGPDFFESWQMVPFLIIGAVYYAFSLFFGAIYGALKKNKNVALTTLIAAIVNIAINFALLRNIGVMAAAISTAISYMISCLYRMLEIRRYYRFPLNEKRFVLNSLIVIMQAIFVSFDRWIYIVSAISLVLLILVNFSDLKKLAEYVNRFIKNKFKECKNKDFDN